MKKKNDSIPALKPRESSVIRPRPLKPGDTIGVVGFASPVEPERFRRGIGFAESLGYGTKVMLDPAAAYETELFLFVSDTPERRAEAFHELLRDPSVTAIVSSRGGYGSGQLLPLIDFDLVRANPKIIAGFSDITAIIGSAFQEAGLLTFHGPSIDSAFAKAESNETAMDTVRRFLAVISGTLADPFEGWTLRRVSGPETAVEGRLAGGNLTLLTALMGTPWESNLDGTLLFFEEIGEKPYRVHRMLSQLQLAGKLDAVRGVIVGSMAGCEPPGGTGPDVDRVLRDIFGPLGIPVYADAPFGHVDRNYPVPVGVRATLEGGRLALREPLFS